MFTLHKAASRGHSDFGWLDSRHSFSFGDYYNPESMGFRTLRVINEDHVAPGSGFPTHPHRDMEIFSYVVSGALAHKDSMGNQKQLGPGEIQIMSAGSGVTHSEFNPSPNQSAHFLQIWLQPAHKSLTPSYSEWKPTPGSETRPKVLLISPDGHEGSATIHQDACVYRLRLTPGQRMGHALSEDWGVWIQVISGSFVSGNGARVEAGDGLAVEGETELLLECIEPLEALLFELH